MEIYRQVEQDMVSKVGGGKGGNQGRDKGRGRVGQKLFGLG